MGFFPNVWLVFNYEIFDGNHPKIWWVLWWEFRGISSMLRGGHLLSRREKMLLLGMTRGGRILDFLVMVFYPHFPCISFYDMPCLYLCELCMFISWPYCMFPFRVDLAVNVLLRRLVSIIVIGSCWRSDIILFVSYILVYVDLMLFQVASSVPASMRRDTGLWDEMVIYFWG